MNNDYNFVYNLIQSNPRMLDKSDYIETNTQGLWVSLFLHLVHESKEIVFRNYTTTNYC